MTTEDNISAAFEEALDDLSDKNLEALRNAFQSGPIRNPGKLISYLFRDVLDQIRYRSGDGLE